jgi:predicted AAA+ superfamily ATPase
VANGYIKRGVDDELLAWKGERERKVLLLRGARQVGKSSSVRNLAGKFEHFLEINFEKDRRAHSLFDGDLNVREICENLSILFKIPIVPGETLVFFDEIQSCPSAISSLRFFYEDYPELHLIAAGSLLEFALEELPSFGVGRIRSIFIIGGMPAVVADYVENGQILNSQKMLNDLIVSLKSDFSK